MKPQTRIYRPVSVGIYDNEQCVLRIYPDLVTIEIPEIRWRDNAAELYIRRESIRDPDTISAIRRELADDCADTAWRIVGQAVHNDHLQYN